MRTLQNFFGEANLWMRSNSLCVVLLFIAGCGGNNNPRDPSDDSPQVYPDLPEEISPHRHFEYPFFEPQNCPADPIFNCTADLTLCEDGSAFILVTDIINGGTYTQTETTIISNWDIGDVPPMIEFSVQSDGSLTDDFYGFTWEPVVASGFLDFCDP